MKPELQGTKVYMWEILCAGERRHGKAYWSCRCECGVTRDVAEHALLSNRSKGCGCNKKELLRLSAVKHGGFRSITYTSWACMKSRCYHKSSPSYPKYGGSGITVCDRWKNSFDNFLSDMGERPSRQHTIHRKENSLGYSPDNCCWATKREQQNGRTITIFLTHEGKTLCLSQWSVESGIRYGLLHRRYSRGLPSNLILSKSRVNG
jgi:hypothetical protein